MRDDLLNIDEAADRLNISRSCLRALLLKHKLTVVRLGRLLFVPPETLDELVRISTGPFVPHTQKAGAGRPRKGALS